MKTVGTVEEPNSLSEGQRAALLSLLTDDDAAVYKIVRHRIVSCGPKALDWLRPHTLSRDPILRRRVQEIVLHFETQTSDDRFLGFCLRSGEELDLEQGAWLLAQTQYPEINVEAYRALLDSFAADLGERIKPSAPAKQTLGILNHYLFEELGFTGNEEDYYNADNSYLNRVIDRRTGNPINLCLLYLLVGRRLKLPLSGVGLPGHFVCRYQSTAAEVYVDVFRRGQLLTKADCVQHLLNTNFSVKEDYMSPVSGRRMLLRICANLHQVYVQSDQDANATRVQRYLVAMGKHSR
jgi:regulator of sirC expression with transglutaminase-like and TPR domain